MDHHGIQRWDWAERIRSKLSHHDRNRLIFNQFRANTAEELWDSREALLGELASSESIQDCLDEKVGMNLLAKYRLSLIAEDMRAICVLAV